jgi:hypothetical protein
MVWMIWELNGVWKFVILISTDDSALAVASIVGNTTIRVSLTPDLTRHSTVNPVETSTHSGAGDVLNV